MPMIATTEFSDLEQVPTPALVLDAAKARRNVERLAAYAASHGIGIRPHTKTHKSVELARLQLEAGARGLTIAKVGEAEALRSSSGAARPDLLDPHPAEMLRRMAEAGLIERSDAESLRATRTLLSDVQSLLRLTLNGDEAAFDETSAPEGQRRLIAATEDAADLGDLKTRIQIEAAAARAIYERIVEEPARVAGWQARRDK